MKALIIADGSPPSGELIQKHGDANLLIAADGGIEAIQKQGLKPDFLIGDFDSANSQTVQSYERTGTKIVRFAAEKNETDGMIALEIALKQGADTIVMLGALGKRTDHALANIMLLKFAAENGADMIIEDEYCEVSLASGEAEINGRTGQTVSILPFMGDAIVSADDSFHYPMRRLKMAGDDPVGISNILKKPRAKVSIVGWTLIFKIK